MKTPPIWYRIRAVESFSGLRENPEFAFDDSFYEKKEKNLSNYSSILDQTFYVGLLDKSNKKGNKNMSNNSMNYNINNNNISMITDPILIKL